MPTINSVQVVSRHNRPNVDGKILLKAFFMNDGAYVDPYAVSSVSIFPLGHNLTPSTVLDSSTNLVSGTPLMQFEPSNAAGDPTLLTNWAAGVDYQISGESSSIFKISTGELAVVLDLVTPVSGVFEGTEISSSAVSTVGDYIDIWTVKLGSGSDWQVFVHEFHLHNDTFYSMTEPLLFTAKSKLINKNVRLGSIVDLRFSTEIGISNKNIDRSVINLFKDSLVTSAAIQIRKIPEADHILEGPFTVSSYSDTSSVINVSSDDTITLSWNTTEISTADTFGARPGMYGAKVQYWILGQKLISEEFFLSVT